MNRIGFFLIISIIGCSQRDGQKSLAIKQSDINQLKLTSLSVGSQNLQTCDYDTLGNEIYPVIPSPSMNGIGVVVVKKNISRIDIINLDNTHFATIDYEKELVQIASTSMLIDEVDNKILNSKFDFKPRLFFIEYEIIHFNCVSKDNNFYTIITNLENEKLKKVKIDPSLVQFYSWEEYVLMSYLLYDPKINPLKEKPDASSKTIYKFNDYYFKGLEIRGEWLRVECVSDCKACGDNVLSGWIQWRHGTKLLVQLGFIC